MRRTSVVGIILASVALRAAPGQAGAGDLLLLDAPRGAWLASVRGDAPMMVLEERDGWRRVRLEGWLAPDTSSPHQPMASAAPAAVPLTAPPGTQGEDSAATIRGVLAPPAGSAAGPGGNAVVLLLGGLEALDAEHARTGADCRQTVDAATARVEELRAESQRVLNSTDNLREASSRSDAIKKEAQAAEARRRMMIQDCRRAADALFDLHALQRTVANGTGRFEFRGVAPGLYRIVATAGGESSPRAWSFDCRVAGSGVVNLDPDANASRVGPYWDLR
jgi:hypothetical protein